ncbi:SMP-30/gluconolactonase/LRE family protein [Sandaracinobacter sp. RS1-74]|uniref:SMP-30/gluconolactonase/LRE family protein n=1 Tax=Sandaracinobacteroides sayramensis TaxID=2913411 RepID=UPI001EDB7763|nr:SMP-30/gluconolactonase/LRE family protein [Sandaracinobacteroides sayramensis]MCG2841129.1 SMP-30/gluconolactonase/LRE family protein [Sandaracinobacteroides sayramensis]
MERREFLRGAALAGLGMASGGIASGAAAGSKSPPSPLPLSAFETIQSGIAGAEGIATAPDGRIFFSTKEAVLAVRETDGKVRHIGTPLAPTGIAADPAGRVLVANMGLLNDGPGPLQRVEPGSGQVETLVEELEGRRLLASNCPTVARDGHVYCSHSSWGPAANIGTTDPAGFIYHLPPEGAASIVARELRGVNGLCLDAGDRHLYAALTAEGRIVRFRRLPDGRLGERENYGPLLGKVVENQMVADIRAIPTKDRTDLGYCDGIAFDQAGNLWVTLPFANRIVAITPDGRLVDIAADPDARTIDMPTNLGWGGRGLRDLHVVCRGAGTILRARTSIAGLPPANWPL